MSWFHPHYFYTFHWFYSIQLYVFISHSYRNLKILYRFFFFAYKMLRFGGFFSASSSKETSKISTYKELCSFLRSFQIYFWKKPSSRFCFHHLFIYFVNMNRIVTHWNSFIQFLKLLYYHSNEGSNATSIAIPLCLFVKKIFFVKIDSSDNNVVHKKNWKNFLQITLIF